MFFFYLVLILFATETNSNFLPDCIHGDLVDCANVTNPCADLDLAMLMCPFTCGFCGTTTTAAPTTTITTIATTTTTTIATTTTAPGMTCPTCSNSLHTDDCLGNLQPCETNHVCQGSIKDWKLSMRCSSALVCQFAAYEGNRNCTSGMPYGPHEQCTFCCQGDQCIDAMKKIQKGFDTITSVLHCPVCNNETDSQACLQRVVPCTSAMNTCQVVNDHGYFTSECSSDSQCNPVASVENCNPSVQGICSYCCSGKDCLQAAFGIGPGNTTLQPVDNTSRSPQSTSPVPNPKCKDSDLYPCTFAKETACNDQDMSLTLCPVTCNKCNEINN